MTTAAGDPTRQSDPTRPGRWCDQHKQVECAKSRKGGGVCHGAAISGLDACRMHAGQRADVARAKGEALSAWRANPGRQDVSPSEAVMAMLQMSWARVHVYAGLLERQVAAADPPRPGGVGQGAGLVGHTFSASPSVGVYESGEAVRALAKLEAEERDRCVRYAKVAHDMGIADREIRLAEAQGALIAGVIGRVLDAVLQRTLEAVGQSAGARLRTAWPGWITELVPRELLAIAGEVGT
ncbi:hypothetical protein [Nonomuraea sp. SYSU D8015]|uniref:hypothetical protein n=1 Tax=Nonomuraea sp. SYSU D8015 TaxID=2593644 RepID=UPI001660EF6A|nr:hypothetical protein [Nonomuraea sp. SYSU D8015]